MGVASGTWKDADIAKVTLPCWWASTRRTLNPRPSRIRSTWNSTGWVGVPGAQEVRVQGVHIALRVHGAPGRDEGLGGDLSAEDPGVAHGVARSRRTGHRDGARDPGARAGSRSGGGAPADRVRDGAVRACGRPRAARAQRTEPPSDSAGAPGPRGRTAGAAPRAHRGRTAGAPQPHRLALSAAPARPVPPAPDPSGYPVGPDSRPSTLREVDELNVGPRDSGRRGRGGGRMEARVLDWILDPIC